MKKATVRIVQRKRLADKANGLGDKIYQQRIKLLPVFVMLASVTALIYLRVQPESAKVVSRVIESSLSQITRMSFLWSPLAGLIALSAAALLYMWMDYQHHKKPLIRVSPKTKYGMLHHLRVVVLPRFKYRWRPALYWLAVAEVCAAVFIAVVAIVGVPSASAFSGDGLGTEQSPYQIQTCIQLQEMHDDLDGHYELAGPIDCTGTSSWNGGNGFLAIGTSSGNEFTGTLDGKDFAVDGLYQRVVDNDAPSGLLGSVVGGTVHNLKLTNVDIASSTGGSTVAPFSSEILNGQLSDISVTGTIQATGNDGAIYTSGFAGLVAVSTVSRVSVNVAIVNNSVDDDDEIGKGAWSAGLAFVLQMSTVTDSYTTGTIAGNFPAGGTAMYAGGFAGQIMMGSVSNSYSSMSISITRNPSLAPAIMVVGGFTAFVAAADMSNNFATGQQSISVGSMVADYRGGLVGGVMFVEDADPPFNENITGSNNFYDITRANQAGCVGAYAGEELEVPVPDQTPGGFCTAVNTGSSQPNYFFNNSTNPPFKVGSTQVWDFTNVWRTVSGGAPIFGTQVPGVPALPGKVRSLTTSSTDATSLTAQWLAPSSNGNSAITNYAVAYKLHSVSTWTPVARTPSTTTSQLITGLTGGQLYDIRVAAINTVGQGDWETTQNVGTSQVPSAARNLVVSGVAQTGQLEPYYFPKLDWQAPEVGAPITDYVIQYKPNAGEDWDLIADDMQGEFDWAENIGSWTTLNDGVGTALSFNASTSSDADFIGLLVASLPGEVRAIGDIEFRVAAVNSYGQGPWSNLDSFQVFIGLTACQQMHDVLDEYPGGVFQLLNNIDCSDTVNWNGGQGWEPIQDEFTPFQGDLDGNGFTISNLHMENQDDYVVGLFAYVENSIIKDLTLSNVAIRSLRQATVSSMVGPLVGVAQGDTILSNVHVTGSVVGPRGAGGIVGIMGNLTGSVTWSNLTFTGVVKGQEMAGGLLAGFGTPGQLTIENSQSHGSLEGIQGAGGAVAFGQGLSLSHVTSDMSILSGCKSAGGLIGTLQVGSLADSEYTGSIQCTAENAGYFSQPTSVAVDAQNQVYVLGHTISSTIYKFSSNGDLLAQWNFAEGNSTNGNPKGIAVDAQSRVYVTDDAYDEVRIFSSSGVLLDTWPTPDPGKLTVDANNNVYIVSGDSVRKYTQDGNLQHTWDGEGAFEQLYDVAVASDGRIYAADIGQDRIHVMDSDGEVITSFDSEGAPSVEFQSPAAIVLDSANNLYVLNGSAHHVVVFDSSYQPIGDWQTPNSEVYSGSDMAMRADGKLTLLGTKVYQLSSNGTVDSHWGGISNWFGSDPGGIAGGLVGVYGGTTEPLTILRSASTGTITSLDGTGKGITVGGLLGATGQISGVTIDASHPEQSLTHGVIINDSNSSMDITAAGQVIVAGGLVGYSDISDINNSSASGDIAVSHDANFAVIQSGMAGGFIGTGQRLTRIRNSHATGQVAMEGFIPTNGQGPIVGGLSGSLAGWTHLDNVYATGSVTVSANQDCNPGQCAEQVSSYAAGLVGLMSSKPSIPALSVVNNVYATGSVNYSAQRSGVFAGGLIGQAQMQYLQLGSVHASGSVSITGADVVAFAGGLFGTLMTDRDTTVQRLYATGSVTNGGRLYSLGGSPSSSAGLIGLMSGPITLQTSYATGDVEGPGVVAGLVGNAIPFAYAQGGGPADERTIENSYATGNVAGKNSEMYFSENSEIGEGYVEFGAVAGGLAGSIIETNVTATYASGTVSNETPEFADTVPLVFQSLYGTATGGLVGSVMVWPLESAPNDLTKVTNSFSATTIQNGASDPKGLIAGRIFRWVEEPYDQSQPSLNPANLLDNNYYDVQGGATVPCATNQLLVVAENTADSDLQSTEFNGQEACHPVNANNQTPNYFKNSNTNPPLDTWDFSTPIWYKHLATHPTFVVGEAVPGPPRNLAGVPTTSSVALSWQAPSSDGGSAITNYRIQYRVHDTNTWSEYEHPEGVATSYTIGGLTSGVRYDFQVSAVNAVGQSTWVLGIYDVLVPGNPTNPTDPTTPTTPTNPTSPNGPTRPTTRPSSGGGTATSNNGGSPNQEEPELLDISKIPSTELPPNIFAVAPRQQKVSIVPYFFLSWLLLLAAYYGYRAIKEYRYQKAAAGLVARTAKTEKSVSDFLAITTHYLGTPLSILKGAMELIASKHALQAEFMATFNAKLTALQTTAETLTLQNEQALSANQAVVADDVEQTTSAKWLWLSMAGIAVAVVVTDIVLMVSKSYSQPWGRALNHAIWAVLGAAIVAVSFVAWSKQKKLRTQYHQTLARERALLEQKNAFLGVAAQQLTTHAAQLRQGTQGLEQFPDTKLLLNGLAMLDKVALALGKVQRFSTINDASPSLNVQEIFTRDIAPALSQEAQTKGVKLTSGLSAEANVQMQPEELQQVVGSVVQNAIQFSNSGSTVTINAQAGHSKSTIAVQDSGQGFTAEAQQHLFEPLTRGVDTATFDHEGLGLNLFITQMILHKHGGDISVASKPQQGTTVTMHLPNSGAVATGVATQVISPSSSS